ncbi:AGE family epimerase/isomerase [Petralouisia muris]|uniref:AGE family epimerase/isomerase n=1 Tax=Petralouisia muris TaxID=3032872 RepID=A0AC61S0E2_9FIRM|nr:AGE family epimerase/isomerase [Petralouisia muris]TGY97844.1 AGE family epimerase/isomerase [Petralouisia muris]
MEKKYIIDTSENRAFMSEIRDNLLQFGRQFPSPEGASYYLGDDGTPWKERNRETWITCRMAHVYSIGTLLGHEGSQQLVDAALKGLTGILKDEQNGGWYAGITPEGSIVQGKQCYAHAFVILASTSALLAGRDGASELLEKALKTFDQYFWDTKNSLTFDAWNTELTVLDDYRGINANMHTVEAFLAVADATGNQEYRERAGRIIDHVIGWAADNQDRIPEHFTKNWEADLECNQDKPDDPFKPYGATPGHGIEWARLISQWACATYGTENDGKYIEMAERLYRRAINDAWNADGAPGIVYTTNWNGEPVVHDRMHWTLAEAINTSAVLYRITKKQEYADDYAMFMQYLDETVLDHEKGSWFHQLDEHNQLMGTVWPGKSDIYHALQATLIPYYPVDVSIAAAVKQNAGKQIS